MPVTILKSYPKSQFKPCKLDIKSNTMPLLFADNWEYRIKGFFRF